MKKTYIHINIRNSKSLISWLLMSLLLVCLTACSSSGDDEMEEQNPETANGSNVPGNAPTKLYIYVYAPEAPEVTRAAYGGQENVNAVGNEAAVYTMQVWVYTHKSHKLIGYYASTGTPGLTTAEPYELLQLTIDDEYAETEEASRENVDVYILGNVTEESCNVTVDGNSTQTEVENAIMGKTTLDPFGVTSPVRSVPQDVGLPMSGVLRDQPVTGESPVLRLDDEGDIATVTLRRIVSKLRFAFARQTDSETLTINSIKLSSEMIPVSEYLFMDAEYPYDRKTCHINTADGYDTSTPELLDEPVTDVPAIDQPVIYAWGNEELEPHIYESRMDEAARMGKVVQRVFYLRESDKKLEGTIKYQIGEGEEQTATFRMVDVGGFSRNHVWTVYAYQAQARLHVVVADVTPWETKEVDHEFYNW